jgi:RNA polymerase sigma factor, sigma-70 family
MTTAAEDIYISYHDKVSAYIRGKLDNHHDAEDLVSQVFEKVYGKIHTFDESKASLSTWIYTITRNTVTDYYRNRRIHTSYDEVYELPAPEKDRDMLDTLADALMILKERERDLILLHYYKGLTLKEVADKMGMSYINAKVIHKKALSGLKTYFQED